MTILSAVSHADYHADNLDGAPHFSRSVALRILQQSPLHAWASHPKLGGGLPDIATAAMDGGALIHRLLLGGGPKVAVIHANDYRKKEVQRQRDEARAKGYIPVLEKHWKQAEDEQLAIRERLAGLGIDLDAYASEQTIVWTEDGVACKARLDLLSDDSALPILDLKITDAISIGAFERGIQSTGLDLQWAAYTSAVGEVRPEWAGRVDLEFILCERRPPHDVAIVPLAKNMQSLGEQRWRRALGIWRQCLASGAWPGLGRQQPIEAKPWQMEAELGAALDARGGDPEWMKGD